MIFLINIFFPLDSFIVIIQYIIHTQNSCEMIMLVRILVDCSRLLVVKLWGSPKNYTWIFDYTGLALLTPVLLLKGQLIV